MTSRAQEAWAEEAADRRAHAARSVEMRKVDATSAQTAEFRALRLTIERLLVRIEELLPAASSVPNDTP